MWMVILSLVALALASPEALQEQLRRDGAVGVRIERVQLDGDAEPEAIVRFDREGSGAFAVVLDFVGGEWREAGKFNTWWNYAKTDGDRLVELLETVEPGVKDLLIRTRNGGTEESRTVVEVWRMRKGQMVPVFTVTEQETAMEHPSGDVYSTVARVSFSLGKVTVESVRQPGDRRTRKQYLWDAARFQFTEAR